MMYNYFKKYLLKLKTDTNVQTISTIKNNKQLLELYIATYFMNKCNILATCGTCDL